MLSSSSINPYSLVGVFPFLDGASTGMMLCDIWNVFSEKHYKNCYLGETLNSYEQKDIKKHTEIFFQHYYRVSLACMVIMLRVGFVIAKYTPTYLGAFLGYGGFCLNLFIFTAIFVLKQYVDNRSIERPAAISNCVSDGSEPGFFATSAVAMLRYIPLVQATVIAASFALLIFYQDFVYLSGAIGFVLLKSTLESDKSFSKETSRHLSVALIMLTHLTGFLTHKLLAFRMHASIHLSAYIYSLLNLDGFMQKETIDCYLDYRRS